MSRVMLNVTVDKMLHIYFLLVCGFFVNLSFDSIYEFHTAAVADPEFS